MIEERVTMRVPNRLLLLCLVVAAMLCLAGCDDDEMTPQSENKKGLTYYDAGDYEKAAEYFSRAIELDNSDMEVHNNYGMTLLQLRRYDEALQQFEIVLANSTALAPKKSETLNKFAIRGKGLVYIQKQNFTDALTCFNNALDIKAENGWNIDILYYKANTLECMGYRPSAIDVYTEVLKEDKENVKAYLSRANLYRIEEKYSEAIADYEKALSLAEGSYLSYIGLYTCSIQMGEKDKAKSLLESAPTRTAIISARSTTIKRTINPRRSRWSMLWIRDFPRQVISSGKLRSRIRSMRMRSRISSNTALRA